MGGLRWDAGAVLRAVWGLQELWCKKMPPTARLFQVYRPQAQPEPEQAPPLLGGPNQDALRGLIRTADGLGALLQYRQQGFLPNKRQQRMAGLAAIEFAQAVRNLVGSPGMSTAALCAPSTEVLDLYAARRYATRVAILHACTDITDFRILSAFSAALEVRTV